MLEYYIKVVEKDTGINVMNKEKARLRMLDALEKQRKVLSANSEAVISVENIAEDYELNHHLKRDEYENIIKDLLDKFRALCTSIKAGNIQKISDSSRVKGQARCFRNSWRRNKNTHHLEDHTRSVQSRTFEDSLCY